MNSSQDPVQPDHSGLHCPPGDFHIDPWRPVPLAVVTHAHADHAIRGCDRYIATPPTADLLKARLGPQINVQPVEFREQLTLGKSLVSLHPAGHVLGSAQVRIEHHNRVCCVTGDVRPTPPLEKPSTTSEQFELVPCNVLITESTFALPIYRWPDPASIARDINAWRAANAAAGRTSVLLAYSLGKAQRVLSMLDPSQGPIGVHGSIMKINAVYQTHGIALPDCIHATQQTASLLKGATIIAPPSAAQQGNAVWLRKFTGPEGLRIAMVSGWMTIRGRRRWKSHDTGFVLSDHADWPGLLTMIKQSEASRVGVTHGAVEPFSRYLREVCGLDAFVVPTRYSGDEAIRDNAEEDLSS